MSWPEQGESREGLNHHLGERHDAYKRLVCCVSEQLLEEDIKQILWHTDSPSKLRAGAISGLDVLTYLERKGKFSELNVQDLAKLLQDVNRVDLMEKVDSYHQQYGRHYSLPVQAVNTTTLSPAQPRSYSVGSPYSVHPPPSHPPPPPPEPPAPPPAPPPYSTKVVQERPSDLDLHAESRLSETSSAILVYGNSTSLGGGGQSSSMDALECPLSNDPQHTGIVWPPHNDTSYGGDRSSLSNYSGSIHLNYNSSHPSSHSASQEGILLSQPPHGEPTAILSGGGTHCDFYSHSNGPLYFHPVQPQPWYHQSSSGSIPQDDLLHSRPVRSFTHRSLTEVTPQNSSSHDSLLNSVHRRYSVPHPCQICFTPPHNRRYPMGGGAVVGGVHYHRTPPPPQSSLMAQCHHHHHHHHQSHSRHSMEEPYHHQHPQLHPPSEAANNSGSYPQQQKTSSTVSSHRENTHRRRGGDHVMPPPPVGPTKASPPSHSRKVFQNLLNNSGAYLPPEGYDQSHGAYNNNSNNCEEDEDEAKKTAEGQGEEEGEESTKTADRDVERKRANSFHQDSDCDLNKMRSRRLSVDERHPRDFQRLQLNQRSASATHNFAITDAGSLGENGSTAKLSESRGSTLQSTSTLNSDDTPHSKPNKSGSCSNTSSISTSSKPHKTKENLFTKITHQFSKVVRSHKEIAWPIKRLKLNKIIYEQADSKHMTCPYKLELDGGLGGSNPKLTFHVHPYGLEEDANRNVTLEVGVEIPSRPKDQRLPSHAVVRVEVRAEDKEKKELFGEAVVQESARISYFFIKSFISHDRLKQSRCTDIVFTLSADLNI